ncbi:CU044_2847 family protein [Streptomyces cupreus]|uniref:Trypsin-co-occurring domain-containing protein n=1 Tax=Streptomyces cupreus TaxID=2759956 RepID=A0A7X1MDH3_9ACTN|nr:hypothetical protein [Streptomyces cupreus]
MPYIGELPLDDGSVLLLEVSGEEPGGVDRVGRAADAVRSSADTLQQALTRMRPALEAVFATTRGLAHAPDEVTVEFGIKLTAEAGVVVARAATEANFTVSVRWANHTNDLASGPTAS